ncbi:MAG: hypothetical protein ACHQM6_05160 [Candidatus Kapaibacterium sp.]
MILYCRDKNHPLYGRRIRIERSTKPEGGIMYVDVLTNVPVDFEPHQLSLLRPETENDSGNEEK